MAISMTFEGVDHKFCGSLLMVVASNLAAHALLHAEPEAISIKEGPTEALEQPILEIIR